MWKKLCGFIFELGQLKRIRHEGWRMALVESPETVAAHSLRAAQIAYILGVMEGYPEPEKLCSMLVFHDIGECRVGDVHKVGSRYMEVREREAVVDQVSELGGVGKAILELWEKGEAPGIAKDADYLEQAFTAKEYIEQGYSACVDWIKNIEKALKTESARKLLNEMKGMKSTDWWRGLKKFS